MPLFTHGKSTYIGCERNRMDFKITVKHINFKTNSYFLVNSHYVIFRKENKNKKFKSKNKSLKADELKHVAIDEKIKFRACLMQDLAHKYLERYIVKDKRFIIRQVTEVPGEELYVDCGYFILPLHVYGMLPSGQDVTVEFKDPNGMASGTVDLTVEHEPRELLGKVLPDFSASFMRLFKKESARSPLPPSVLVTNQDKLDFLKSRKLSHHHSRYDVSDDEASEAEDTLSESDEEGPVRPFNGSFTLTSGVSGDVTPVKDGSMRKQESVELHDGMFHLDELPATPVPAEKGPVPILLSSKSHSNKTVGSGENIDTPRSMETMSTITMSAKDHASPRHGRPVSIRAMPELPEESAEESGAEHSPRNRVPFAPVKAGAAATNPSTNKNSAAPVAVVARPLADEDGWEQVPAEWLMTPADVPGAVAVTAPEPAPARTIIRAKSENTAQPAPLSRVPSFRPPQQPTGAVSNAAPAPAPRPGMSRANSEPGTTISARALLNMTSQDEADMSNTVRSMPTGPVAMSPQVQAQVQAQAPPARPGHKTIKVPVRLGSQNNIITSPPPAAAVSAHTAHRSQSTSDLRAEHLHQYQQGAMGVSVKELRRNFEKPPLHKETSGSTASHSSHSDDSQPHFAGLTQSNLPRQAPAPRLSRAESERSYSTLSTHDTLPARPMPSGAKLLVPVRLKSTQQEPYYSGSGAGGIGYSNATNSSSGSDAYQREEHHLHRTSTAPVLLQPVRMSAAVAERDAEYRSAPVAAHHQSPLRRAPTVAPPPMSGEKASRHDYAYQQQSEAQHHELHRTSTAPALGRGDDYARSLQAAAYGGYAPREPAPHRQPSPQTPYRDDHRSNQHEYHHHQQQHASHQQDYYDTHREHYHHERERERERQPVHRAGSAHVMAPPIRLKTNDAIPDDYQRYTHNPGEVHHRHHHEEVSEHYRAEYLREAAYGDHRRGQGVYA